MSRIRFCAAALLALSSVVAGTTLRADPFEALPLGPQGLTETRSSQQIARGLTYTRIVRGATSPDDYFTVFIFRESLADAQTLAQRLITDGFQPQIETIEERAFDDPRPGPLGWRVTIGRFDTMEAANAERDALTALGYTLLRVVYTGEDGGPTTGPWVVHVLELDPKRFRGEFGPALGSGIVPDNERLSSIAAAAGALAAINGGYFVIGAADGTPGDLAGISMIDGSLVSEAVRGRTSLILHASEKRPAAINALTTEVSATTDDGATRIVDGLNRKPGLIRGCGGTGDTPTDLAKHDFTCTDTGELILFRRIFGAQAEPGAGIEVALAANGTVTEVRTVRGGTIPANGAVIAGTGDGADWLLAHARLGTVVRVRTRVFTERGGLLTSEEGAGIVNGGPRLLRDGSVDITAAAEGFVYPENAEFYYRFGGRRNPRTLAGVTEAGHLLLVAVDGRAPGYSVGASFIESARLLKALGAADGVNLDGGGSTTITLGPTVMNRPSDATGERPIGDAIIMRP